jgi:hypothetical protein
MLAPQDANNRLTSSLDLLIALYDHIAPPSRSRSPSPSPSRSRSRKIYLNHTNVLLQASRSHVVQRLSCEILYYVHSLVHKNDQCPAAGISKPCDASAVRGSSCENLYYVCRLVHKNDQCPAGGISKPCGASAARRSSCEILTMWKGSPSRMPPLTSLRCSADEVTYKPSGPKLKPSGQRSNLWLCTSFKILHTDASLPSPC